MRAQTWREEFGNERATIILAVLRDKDVGGILRASARHSTRILPYVRTARAVPPDDVVQIISAINQPSKCQSGSDLHRPIPRAALDSAERTRRILITGSLHFAGEALATLDGNWLRSKIARSR